MGRGAQHRKLFTLWLLILFALAGIIYMFAWPELKPTMCTFPASQPKDLESIKMVPAPQSSTSPEDHEIESLVKMLEWPEPPGPINFQASTSPNTTDFYLLMPASTYRVGDYVKVQITARDHRGHPKTYGGDYFHAKLYSQSLKAGVTGSITDHRNGTYTASFLLLWPGNVSISIVLIHSSEAIFILREKRENRPDKIFYKGYFADNGTVAEVECNVMPPSHNVCTYHDQGTGETWYCTHPLNLPCTAYVDHSAGGLRKIYTPTELQYFFREKEEAVRYKPQKEHKILSRVKPITVLPHTSSHGKTGRHAQGHNDRSLDPGGTPTNKMACNWSTECQLLYCKRATYYGEPAKRSLPGQRGGINFST